MIHVQKHLDLLGARVRDRVTGIEGIVESVSFDLYGCIQTVVNPGLDKDKKPQDSRWMDVSRLEIKKATPVMPRPPFDYSPADIAAGRHGPAAKPAR